MISEEHCVHVKRTTRGTRLLNWYVDDIQLDGDNLEIIEATRKWLSSVFGIKDMGEGRYILCVQIIRNLELDKKSRELNPRVG